MSGYSGSSISPRKRGRPPNPKKVEKEVSVDKRLRDKGITKEIKIILERCDAQLTCTRNIDLPPPILEANGLIPSPSSSNASYPPPLLRREVNGIIRPKLKSKKKVELESDLHKAMAPGVEISSPRPRSSKRLQNGSKPSSNGDPVGNMGNLSPPSSTQVSLKKKLSRYKHDPPRLRSTRSGSNSHDDKGPQVEEKSKSIESLAISKARKIKKKIMESQLSSPPPTEETPPPTEAEAPPPNQAPPKKKKRGRPPFPRSRTNSKDEIIEQDNESLTPPVATTALSNGPQIENEILDSSPPSSSLALQNIAETPPPPPTPVKASPPPTETETASPRQKKRRLPAYLRSRSNSKDNDEITGEDNESLAPPVTSAVSNGPRIENEILESSPPSSPLPLQKIAETTPPRPTVPVQPLQNSLPIPHPSPSPSEDEVVGISTSEDDDGSPNLEIVGVKSLAKNNFLLTPFSTPPASVAYYCCVMWDLRILNELQCHEDSRHQLYIANSIGKLLSESLKSEGHSFPGVAQMNWKRTFILLDIISADFSKCGIFTCLRVQEKASIDTIRHLHRRPPKWDIVIHPQCSSIGEEMVRMHRSGIKTTVVIWGAHISKYPQPWNDLHGEIFLTPSKKDSEALSVIIFHHETLSHERFRLIQDAHQGSELWPNFQDPQLNHRIFMQADLVHRENPTHFTLHAEKLHNPSSYKAAISNVNIVEGAVEVEDCEEVAEFPEFDSCDEEEFDEEDDDQFSLDPYADEDWDDLESASCLGMGSAGENMSSPDVQASVSQDMQELAARIFRRSQSVPAVLTSPRRGNDGVQGDLEIERESVCESGPQRKSIERRARTRDPDNEGAGEGGGDQGGAGVVGVEVDVEPNKCRVVSDSQKKFLLTQEVVETDEDEDQVDNGHVSHDELEQSVLDCDEDFVTGDEGEGRAPPSPALASLLRVAKSKSKSPVGTKVKKGSDGQTNLCNGYGHGPSSKKMNLTQNGMVAKKIDLVKSMNGTEKPPPSNTEHSEYNYSELLQEF